jgi:hypothetical protein
MKIALIAALTLATAASASAPHEAPKAPWLVAQYDRKMPSCKNDDREVPVGTTMCREGNTWICSGRGTWDNTGKRC